MFLLGAVHRQLCSFLCHFSPRSLIFNENNKPSPEMTFVRVWGEDSALWLVWPGLQHMREAVSWLLAHPMGPAAGPGSEAHHRRHEHIRAPALRGSWVPKLSRRGHPGLGLGLGHLSFSLPQIFRRKPES